MRIKRILVPIDFSADSLQALELAVDFAKPHRAELIVLLVIEPISFAAPDFAGAQTGALAELLAEQRRSARAELARLEQRYAKRRIALRAMVGTGRPSQVIVDSAKQLKADVIVMATRGRTGLAHLLTGSVAERVVRTATCPVLTMHGRARKARTARLPSKLQKRGEGKARVAERERG
jgi:nucleotide-binding universal stress UspA family protein